MNGLKVVHISIIINEVIRTISSFFTRKLNEKKGKQTIFSLLEVFMRIELWYVLFSIQLLLFC